MKRIDQSNKNLTSQDHPIPRIVESEKHIKSVQCQIIGGPLHEAFSAELKTRTFEKTNVSDEVADEEILTSISKDSSGRTAIVEFEDQKRCKENQIRDEYLHNSKCILILTKNINLVYYFKPHLFWMNSPKDQSKKTEGFKGCQC